jgi:hypothetical protein
MRITVRLPEELMAAVDERAETEDRSRSAAIRRVLEKEFGLEKAGRRKGNLSVTVQPVRSTVAKPAPEPGLVLAGRPQCEGCRGPLRMMKGKLICCRIGCSREGQVQGEA